MTRVECEIDSVCCKRLNHNQVSDVGCPLNTMNELQQPFETDTHLVHPINVPYVWCDCIICAEWDSEID